MALQIGLSEAFIGIAIVGVGTSLPEVAASCVAAWRGKADLAIGNVVGSNIFNIFWVLGLSATIRPILYDPALNPDVLMTILAGFALFLAVVVGRAKILHRGEGLLFLLMYFAYLTIRVLFGDALARALSAAAAADLLVSGVLFSAGYHALSLRLLAAA